jgi:mediator of RNA polymerase II transcription subunit 8
MATHSDVFEKTVAYPSTNFPGRTQENLLFQLLRKKLEPGVESWVEEGRAIQSTMDEEGDLPGTWQAASDFIGERIARAARTHRREIYTTEEKELGIENVNTGLKKPMKLGDDEESGSDEDEDEDMDDEESESDSKSKEAEKKFDGPARNLDEIVRFMTTGLTPEDDSQLSSGLFFRR